MVAPRDAIRTAVASADGPVVCLGLDNLRLVLTERLFTTGLGPQPSLDRKVGLNPFDAGIVHVKTGVGFQYTYGDAAQAVVRADCPSAVSYNLDNFEFEHVPRPMFLLDAFDDGSAPPGQFL